MVGRPVLRFEEKGGKGNKLKDIMIGDEAAENRNLLQITYPVDKGECMQDAYLWLFVA
jgi:actin-related protein 2